MRSRPLCFGSGGGRRWPVPLPLKGLRVLFRHRPWLGSHLSIAVADPWTDRRRPKLALGRRTQTLNRLWDVIYPLPHAVRSGDFDCATGLWGPVRKVRTRQQDPRPPATSLRPARRGISPPQGPHLHASRALIARNRPLDSLKPRFQRWIAFNMMPALHRERIDRGVPVALTTEIMRFKDAFGK